MEQPRLRYVAGPAGDDLLSPIPFPRLETVEGASTTRKLGDDVLAVIDRMRGTLDSLQADLDEHMRFTLNADDDGAGPRPAA